MFSSCSHPLRCCRKAAGTLTTVCKQSVPRNGVEFSTNRVIGHDEDIPVPWGVIGARRWGDPSKKPILCVHGWKDNLATFDTLMPIILPQLQDKYFFLTVDLPGHGHSSHFPPGMMYQITDCLVLIRRILNHYNWSTISYLGHSLGAILGFIFNGSNPGVFERYIAIDALTPLVFTKAEMMNLVPKLIADTLRFEEKLKKKQPPLYSFEEIKTRVLKTHMGIMNDKAARILLARGIKETKPGSGMFHFSHDIRVQYLPLMTLSTKQVAYIGKNIRSHVLHIRATDGVKYEKPKVVANSQQWLKTYKPLERDVNFIEVPGNHHVHLNTPETVAPHIVKFLNKDLRDVE